MASFFIRRPHRRDCDRDPYRYSWRDRDCAFANRTVSNIAPRKSGCNELPRCRRKDS